VHLFDPAHALWLMTLFKFESDTGLDARAYEIYVPIWSRYPIII
jgi:hypothetical protein